MSARLLSNLACHGLRFTADWKNMGYNRFRFQITLRVILLGATLFLFVWLLIHTSLYATTVFVGLIVLYELYALIRIVEKTNSSLMQFLESIRYSDFSRTFSETDSGMPYTNLHKEFNTIMQEFKKERAGKEVQHLYLQTVVQHVGIALISFREDGTVELINTAAKRLLKVPHLKNVKSLESFSPELVDTLINLKSGERKLVKVNDNSEILQLTVYASEFMMMENRYTLVSITNIQSELEEQEMKAWQDLIRVLTHEIMNSVTPIASLASTVSGLLQDVEYGETGKSGSSGHSEDAGDIISAVETIRKRSEGLLHFVENYRNLTRIPKPDFSIFPVSELFGRVRQLMQTHIEDRELEFLVTVEPDSLELTADSELIEQVLINLLLNAFEAAGNRSGTKIGSRGNIDDRDRIILYVFDNGPGIVDEVVEKIFIPFFTTRQEGSGIGLSLSRQIMRLHGGTISVRSEPNVETVFTLRF